MEENIYKNYLVEEFDKRCQFSTIGNEATLHQLSPYIGKIKSSIASFLISNFTSKGDIIFDPFCGAGTIPLEAWLQDRNVIANDLSYYAFVLTQAKLFPPFSLDDILTLIEDLNKEVDLRKGSVNVVIPEWVSKFFHAETLREIITWTLILREREHFFLIACLLGILHHQRPGFLSFPSSHTVPYLRMKKFPIANHPELYEYREVKSRLINKVKRAYKRIPKLNNELIRICYNNDASLFKPNIKVDSIITSPPYMRQLDYARDNRLRLWFLNIHDYKNIDSIISPSETDFLCMISKSISIWDNILKDGGNIILFVGDNYSKTHHLSLPQLIEKIVLEQLYGYKLIFKHESLIPNNRRVRREHKGNKQETILVFKKPS